MQTLNRLSTKSATKPSYSYFGRCSYWPSRLYGALHVFALCWLFHLDFPVPTLWPWIQASASLILLAIFYRDYPKQWPKAPSFRLQDMGEGQWLNGYEFFEIIEVRAICPWFCWLRIQSIPTDDRPVEQQTWWLWQDQWPDVIYRRLCAQLQQRRLELDTPSSALKW
jgi:hypothetical protein